MNRFRSHVALLSLALAATLLVAGCDSGDIHSVAYKAGCPVPGPFTVNSGSGPTVNPDGSLTYTTSSVVTFNRPFTSITRASMCAEVALTPTTFFAGGMAAGPSGGIAIVVNWFGSGQIAVTFDDNNSGTACPDQIFGSPAYVAGGLVRLAAVLDQTGPLPAVFGWVDSDPAGPPDLDSTTPWCSADSSGWALATGFDAYSQGSNMTVNRYGFGP